MAIPERLTLFFDIAGRVTKANVLDSYITVGGVLIPTGKEDEVRQALNQALPKWKDASPESLEVVKGVLANKALQSVILRIEKSQPAWDQFWDDGTSEHNELTALINQKVGFARPGTVAKYVAFGGCAAIGLAENLKRHGLPSLVDQSGLGILRLRVILDTDILGDDNRDTFEDVWNAWAESARMREVGIAPEVELVDFRSEQVDPVLLLPDYLAGWAHHRASQGSVDAPSNLDRSDIDAFGQAIEASVNGAIITWQFGEEFPDLTRRSSRRH